MNTKKGPESYEEWIDLDRIIIPCSKGLPVVKAWSESNFKITKEDSETAAMMLEKALTQVEQSLQASRLPIQVNAVKQLQALSDDTALNATFTTLDREMRWELGRVILISRGKKLILTR